MTIMGKCDPCIPQSNPCRPSVANIVIIQHTASHTPIGTAVVYLIPSSSLVCPGPLRPHPSLAAGTAAPADPRSHSVKFPAISPSPQVPTWVQCAVQQWPFMRGVYG